MSSQITDLEKITLTVTEENAAGASVHIAGVPVWTSSNDAAVTVVAAADGLTSVASSVAAGVATVTVSVDGLSATFDVTVTQSPGTQLVITASAPEPK